MKGLSQYLNTEMAIGAENKRVIITPHSHVPVKDWQIIQENWMEKMTRNAMDKFPTIRKARRIPVEIWEQIEDNYYLRNTEDGYPIENGWIQNKGGRTYLVTTQKG